MAAAKRTKKKDKKSTAPKKAEVSVLLNRMNSFVQNRGNTLLVLILLCFFIVGGLLFNAYIVPMADDADFLVASNQLIKHGIFPGHHSILFSITLAVIAGIFGFNVLAFKIFSFICCFVGLLAFYYFLKDRFPPIVTMGILFFMATNFAIQFYSSSTMSEAFFMLMQVFYIVVAYFAIQLSERKYDSIKEQLGVQWKSWVGIGLFLTIFSISKNIEIVSPLVLALFFLLYRKYFCALFTILSFGFFRIIYSVFLLMVFGEAKRSGQWDELLLKNSYNPTEGTEDLSGLVVRYFSNLNHHFSTDFFRIIGLRTNEAPIEPIAFLTLIVVTCCLYLLYVSYSKDKFLFFLGLYLLTVLSVVFVALQTHWKQERMVLVFVPFLLLFLLSVIHLIVNKKNGWWQSGFILLLIVVNFGHLRHLPAEISKNKINFSSILDGDIYGGYTQDWKNYLKMSRWVSDELTEASRVACRKPNTSIVYGQGKEIFYGLYRSTQKNGQEVLADFKAAGVTHIMACNLRLNPAQAIEGRVIGTSHSFVRAIYNYDKNRLKPIHTEGTEEVCNLYEILY